MVATDVFIPPSVALQPRPLPYWRACGAACDTRHCHDYKEKMRAARAVMSRTRDVTDPDAVRQVLREEQAKFGEGALFRRMLAPAARDALLTVGAGRR